LRNRFNVTAMAGFVPDCALDVDVIASPNHGERRGGARPSLLILHYTGMEDADEALERLCSPQSEVSAHYLVFEDARIVQCVQESRRAWHAGVSAWNDITDINSHSIGIEIANPGHEFGYTDYPSAQVDAVIALCRDIVDRHAIAADRLLGHSDVAPARKLDPGEKFPWRSLYAAGLGHWTEPAPLGGKRGAFAIGASGTGVSALQEALRRYGYGLGVTGVFDDSTQQVVRAFQRHFRPARVDGLADRSTRRTLAALLATRPDANRRV
jgi:N-acetylmuramoyl-L-alanine amidase